MRRIFMVFCVLLGLYAPVAIAAPVSISVNQFVEHPAERCDFLVTETILLSIAKAIGHSRIAADRQRGGHINHTGGPGVQYIVLPD